MLYCNDGDWVESCTALVEHFDGHLEIIRWSESRALDPLAGQERELLVLATADAVEP